MLKWGRPGRGVKCAKVPPTPYAYYSTAPRRFLCNVPDVSPHCTVAKRTTNAGLSPKLVWRAPFARQVERSLRAPTPDGGAGLSDGQMKVVKDCLKSLASSRE